MEKHALLNSSFLERERKFSHKIAVLCNLEMKKYPQYDILLIYFRLLNSLVKQTLKIENEDSI